LLVGTFARAFEAGFAAGLAADFDGRRGRCGGPVLRGRRVIAAFFQQKLLNFKSNQILADISG